MSLRERGRGICTRLACCDLAYSEGTDIADMIYRGAMDGSDQLRYLAGNDAIAMAEARERLSDEADRDGVIKYFNL